MLADRSILSEAPPPPSCKNRGRDSQPNTRWSFGTLTEELREDLMDLEKTGTHRKTKKSQLTWALGGFTETEPPTKHTRAEPRHPPQIWSRLVFMWVPQQLGWGLSLNLLPTCGTCSPNWAALSDPQWPCRDLMHQSAGAPRGSGPPHSQKERGLEEGIV